MSSLDTISIGILLGSLLVLAGILSSLVALRFGAPLLLIFLLLGMLAGEAGPLGIKFDDVQVAYTVGSVALGLILFDGGLRTRFQTFRNVAAPAGMLATVGVLASAALTARVDALRLLQPGLWKEWRKGHERFLKLQERRRDVARRGFQTAWKDWSDRDVRGQMQRILQPAIDGGNGFEKVAIPGMRLEGRL